MVSFVSYSQEYMLEVSSFVLEENSLTAKNEPVRDTNNQKCALVIITGFEDENLRFNVGNIFSKVEEKKNNQGERVYLLWIPEGTVKVTISSDSKSFSPVEYFFNPRVKKAETYLMDLKLSATKSLAGKQYLQFQIDPVNAYLEVNEEPWDVKNGIAYKQLPRGIYNYRVQAKNYHTEVGTVDFSDLSVKKEVQISLKPNFGWLTITPPANLNGGLTVLIDNEISSEGLDRIQLSSGQHSLKVTRESYLPFTQTINIEDGKEIKITPVLMANFSTVTITTKGDASIYIDDRFVGTGNWTGPLSIGTYAVEIKKDNHKSISQTISVPKIGEVYTHEYKEPTPILGSVSVETNPPGAFVKIDGKEYGKTPIFIPELIIGNHSINITLKDHKTHSTSFTVEEGKQIDLSYSLEKGVDVPKPTPTVPSQRPSQDNSPNRPVTPVRHNTYTGKKKYAIMDVDKIIQSMSEYAALQRQIAERQKQAERTLASLQEKMNKAYDDYQKKPNSKNSDAVQAASTTVQNFEKSSKEEIEKFQKDQLAKLQKKVSDAANIVGRENGYEVIFPVGAPLYTGSDVIDATELVKRKLNY